MPTSPRRAAIVGVGQTDFGALYANKDATRNAHGLATAALRAALDDAQMDKSHLDGLITSWVDYGRMATVLGIRNPRVVHDLQGAGRMSGMAVREAVTMVEAGVADTIALVYGNNGRSVKMKYGGAAANPIMAYDTMYGQTSAGAELAMMYRRYQHEFNIPDGALAPIAINNRRNAARNPVAVMRSEITERDYLDSRFIAEPLRLLDYCIINDGGVALIITTLDRARDLPKRPVTVAASASRGDLWGFYASPDFFYDACQHVAQEVYGASRPRPGRHRLRADLRQLHSDRAVQPRRVRLRQTGRRPRVDQERSDRNRRGAPDQHRRRPYRRELHAGLGSPCRGRAPDPWRERRTPSHRMQRRPVHLRVAHRVQPHSDRRMRKS